MTAVASEQQTAPEAAAATRPAHTPAPTPPEERWMSDRLDLPWHELYAGVTDVAIRRDRIRARIIGLGWSDTRAGYRDGKAETWRELFERLYGVPLGEAP